MNSLIHWLQGLPKESSVIAAASLPILELRGSIPWGLYLGLPLGRVIFLSIIGNLIPVVPLLVFLKPLSERLRHLPGFNRFFDWLFERAKRKGDIIQRYEALGLMIFVGIPLPMTGAWTGAIAASLFKIRFRYAFPAIVGGILLASVVVSALCSLGIMTWNTFNH